MRELEVVAEILCRDELLSKCDFELKCCELFFKLDYLATIIVGCQSFIKR